MRLGDMARAFVRRLGHDPRQAIGLVAWRLRHDPYWVMLKLSAALSPRVREPMLERLLDTGRRRLARRPQSTLALMTVGFALVELGQREAAERFVQQYKGHARPRARIGLARLLTEADRPGVALSLLKDLGTDAKVLEARGRALARRGQLVDGHAALNSAVQLGSPSARVERDRTASTLRALSIDWQPSVPDGAGVLAQLGRVLHFLNNSLPHVVAGYTVRTHQIACAQRDAGLDPIMVTRAGFPVLQGVFDAADQDVVDGITYHRLPAHGLARQGMADLIQANVERLTPLVERFGPALLQPTSPYENARVALALKQRFGLPVVYEVRGFLEETWLSRYDVDAERSDRYELTQAIETHCMRAADHVVTLAEAMRDDMARRGVDPERVTVIPNAVDVDDFAPLPADPTLRARLGIGEGEVVVGYVSSLVGYEGVRYLLDAVALLRARGREVHALIVGDGAERAALEHHAARLGLRDAATFTGRVPLEEVRRYYAQIDVFVVPRTGDRVSRMVTPLKPLEAMAMERAVVTSDVEALREIIQPGETGLTFAAEDASNLADTLEPLLDDLALRERLGKAGREWVIAERTWQRNGERYRALYEQLGAA